MTILDEIIAYKIEREIPARLTAVSLAEMQARAQAAAPAVDLVAALRHAPGVALIAEVKRASPSKGLLCPNFDPLQLAAAYAANGAAAISVLTDERFFQGQLDYLSAIRRQHPRLPLLRKDFIVDPYQVYETRACGADAMLLIAECLETSEMIDLQILATELNLTVLIEVHDMENLLRVRDNVIGFPHKSYSLLGINNRDLRTFRTDLGTTLRMAELVENRDVLVSESGINTRADIEKLANAGVKAVLVGESLMRSPDIAKKISELFG
jgi:indole-3-glycerol phosphate synthase